MRYSFLLILILILGNDLPVSAQPRPKVVIGYVAGYNGVLDAARIDARKLTHINYAFVDIRDNRAWLHNGATDSTNFVVLNSLKQYNPNIKLLISIGGWSWSKNFSNAVLSDSARYAFAASAVKIMIDHRLDGVDIDWEYPNMPGDGNAFQPADIHNYTLLFAQLRRQLDSVTKITGRTYLLTTATGAFREFLRNTEMKEAARYLDYVNLMTYDWGWDKAAHHTALYASGPDSTENCTDRAVQDFIQAGVPASKIVIGLAFYGRGGITATTANNGLGQSIVNKQYSGGYTYIKDSILTNPHYKLYWDTAAAAPYVFNAVTRHFISFDNERSVAMKCDFVNNHKLAGVMFWEYSADEKEYLLNVVDRELRRQR